MSSFLSHHMLLQTRTAYKLYSQDGPKPYSNVKRWLKSVMNSKLHNRQHKNLTRKKNKAFEGEVWNPNLEAWKTWGTAISKH